MDVEVEVVEERVSRFLVTGALSLEQAERIALDMSQSRGRLNHQVPRRWTEFPKRYVQYSRPVLVRDGEIVGEDGW